MNSTSQPQPGKPTSWALNPVDRKKRRAREAAALTACAKACCPQDQDRATIDRVKKMIETLLVEARVNAREEALLDALDAANAACDNLPADWTVQEWKYGWKQGASEAFLRVGALIAPVLTEHTRGAHAPISGSK